MKIIDVIKTVDELYPNNYQASEKINWCDELGAMLRQEYAKVYEDNVQKDYENITDPISEETIAPPPYDRMYIDFVLAKICYYQRDYDAYNQHIISFNSKLEDFARWYIERNMPVRTTDNAVRNWW